MNSRRPGRAHMPSRRLLESGSAIAVIEDNGLSADNDGDQTMADDQLNNTMDLDKIAADPKETARVQRLAKLEDQKRRRAIAKEKFDSLRAEEYQEAKKQGISLWRLQENQREEGRRRKAQCVQEEAATPMILGHSTYDLPARTRSKTLTFPGMVPSEPPKPTKQSTKKEKAAEHQKGAGRNHQKHDKNIKKHSQLMRKYKINKVSTVREKKEHDRKRDKRDKIAARLAEKDIGDLAIAMFDKLVLGDSVNVTYRGAKVAPDVGIWNMFGGKPDWYQPLRIVDPNILDLFPLGQPLPCFTEERIKYELSNREYKRQLAESLGMSVRRLMACFNRTKGPKPGGLVIEPSIKELAGYEQSVKAGGCWEPFTSQLQSSKKKQYMVAMKVQALRRRGGLHETGSVAQHSKRRVPVASIRQEGLRRQPFLRERAFRNIVHIQELREQHVANTMDTDMDADDDVLEIPKPNLFKARVTHGAGIKLKPFPIKGGVTFRQFEAMEAEARALRGEAKTVRSEPITYNEDGDPIRCICGDPAHNDDVDGKWICCDECEVWQHNVCVGASLNEEVLRDMEYYCEECRPEDHEEYLEALARGEEEGEAIWRARKAKYEEDEQRKKAERWDRRQKRKAKRAFNDVMDGMLGIKVEDDDA